MACLHVVPVCKWRNLFAGEGAKSFSRLLYYFINPYKESTHVKRA